MIDSQTIQPLYDMAHPYDPRPRRRLTRVTDDSILPAIHPKTLFNHQSIDRQADRVALVAVPVVDVLAVVPPARAAPLDHRHEARIEYTWHERAAPLHHPLVGELRVVDLIHEWIHHDQNHIKQILNNIQAYVWPNMGNAQNFGKIY